MGTIAAPEDDSHLYVEQQHHPNYVHPISILQLDNLVREPSLPRLVKSCTFLKQQLPARLENHVQRLKAREGGGRGAHGGRLGLLI